MEMMRRRKVTEKTAKQGEGEENKKRKSCDENDG